MENKYTIEDVCRLDKAGKTQLVTSLPYETLIHALMNAPRDLVSFFIRDIPGDIKKRIKSDTMGICRGAPLSPVLIDKAQKTLIDHLEHILTSNTGSLLELPLKIKNPVLYETKRHQQEIRKNLKKKLSALDEQTITHLFILLAHQIRSADHSDLTSFCTICRCSFLKHSLHLLSQSRRQTTEDFLLSLEPLYNKEEKKIKYYEDLLNLKIKGFIILQTHNDADSIKTQLTNDSLYKNRDELISTFITYRTRINTNGILSLTEQAQETTDRFLKLGLDLMITGYDQSFIEKLLHIYKNTLLTKRTLKLTLLREGIICLHEQLSPATIELRLKAHYMEDINR